MGRRGTKVARKAADMVLQDDALRLPSSPCRSPEGRIVFGNLRRFAYLSAFLQPRRGALGGHRRFRRPAATAPPAPDPISQPGDGRLPGIRAWRFGEGEADVLLTSSAWPPKEPTRVAEQWRAITGHPPAIGIAASTLVRYWSRRTMARPHQELRGPYPSSPSRWRSSGTCSTCARAGPASGGTP